MGWIRQYLHFALLILGRLGATRKKELGRSRVAKAWYRKYEPVWWNDGSVYRLHLLGWCSQSGRNSRGMLDIDILGYDWSNTCSMPSGTATAGQRFSVLTFPATFCKDVLYNERVSGVSKADRRIDCRRYAELMDLCYEFNDDIYMKTSYWPSRYQGFIREKSVSCDSFGSLLRCESTN